MPKKTTEPLINVSEASEIRFRESELKDWADSFYVPERNFATDRPRILRNL